VNELESARWCGYSVVGVCTDKQPVPDSYAVPVFQGLDRIAVAAEVTSADAVVVLPCRHLGAPAIRRLGWQLERARVQLLVAPGLGDVVRQRATYLSAGCLPLLHVAHAELTGLRRVAKEVFDRTAAALGLLVAAPVLLALVLAIRVETPGPAIFRQERIGRNDKHFTVFKLRTMTHDAEDRLSALLSHNDADGALFKMRADPRVTRVGRLLRRYSLDELPQLFNVVLGQMSLVGPRPALPSEVGSYAHDVRRRMVVKPGLTGLWQVSGRSNLPWEEAVRLDLRYVENWSLMLDVWILCRTVRAVLSGEGAY
jgi:exopolysaccharide biosynthesis polyprenyl glycosylphosphotransferase